MIKNERRAWHVAFFFSLNEEQEVDQMEKTEEKFIKRLQQGVSPFHVVKNCEEELLKAGFTQLDMEKPWKLTPQKQYFINHHGTTLAAFSLPDKQQMLVEKRKTPVLRIAAAHSDWPCLRVKPSPDIKDEYYGKINTEVYGGAIYSTWLDRPLGVAGRVALRSKNAFCPTMRLFDSERPILTIPELAIHMNREVNNGVALNPQREMLPLFATGEKRMSLMQYLAEKMQVPAEDILDFELSCYNADLPQKIGAEEELLSAPRIDNVSSVEAVIEAIQGKSETALNMAVIFDHEEIGSRSKQGALSAFLPQVIAKIYESAGLSGMDARDAIYQGMMLSVDVAHALHPNYPDKEDITNRPVLNGGFCIKQASSQSYATDSEAVAIVEQLAAKANAACQTYVNRSDMRGGSTLGSLLSAQLPMKTADVGIPILAMHSARELMGISDLAAMRDLLCAFFQSEEENA